MKTRFGGVHRKSGNVYLGVGLLADRPSASAPAPVKGLVKGFERGGPESEVLPSSQGPARENPEGGFTTLHPSPPGKADGASAGPIAAPASVPLEDDNPRSAWDSDDGA